VICSMSVVSTSSYEETLLSIRRLCSLVGATLRRWSGYVIRAVALSNLKSHCRKEVSVGTMALDASTHHGAFRSSPMIPVARSDVPPSEAATKLLVLHVDDPRHYRL